MVVDQNCIIHVTWCIRRRLRRFPVHIDFSYKIPFKDRRRFTYIDIISIDKGPAQILIHVLRITKNSINSIKNFLYTGVNKILDYIFIL